jgi:hypothetical protein
MKRQYLHLRHRLRNLPLHRDPTSICLLRLFHKAKTTRTALSILSSSHHNIFSTGSIRCIMLIPVPEALCLEGMKSRTTHHLLPHPLQATFPNTPSNSLLKLDAMGLIHRTVAMPRTCPTGTRQWALLQDTIHVRTIS